MTEREDEIGADAEPGTETEFDPEKFEEKYVYYFEELETAYSNAYQQLHGRVDSEVLRAIDRQVLSESEPLYEGDGEFSVELPDDPKGRVGAVGAGDEQFEAVLSEFTERIEGELRRLFGFDSAE
ncbi:hypothetical protein C483_18053 [Natrialba hulunbeirensis JCM 10989]|uniref:Uncharacterized protein n=1 Tax=Natrialba hulunbeirensis JCM 10989 TaxID=1227493 RepID=L9ZP38_9EURY|nr:DUF5783 family protein [Natrialba hulunbeirensis]ELY87826.1 hypothetical protein C483_18053 [Natrialba hulunbeirensis JCM 10989]